MPAVTDRAEARRLQRTTQKCGREDLPLARGQGRRPRGATPLSKEQWLHGCRRVERSYSTFKVRRGGCEEIPLIQAKEQQLLFAGAAMKR